MAWIPGEFGRLCCVWVFLFNYRHHESATNTHCKQFCKNIAREQTMRTMAKWNDTGASTVNESDVWHAKFRTAQLQTSVRGTKANSEKKGNEQRRTNEQTFKRKLLIFIMTLYLNKTMSNSNGNNDKGPTAEMCYSVRPTVCVRVCFPFR